MKKILSVVLVLLLLISLASCGGREIIDNSSTTEETVNVDFSSKDTEVVLTGMGTVFYITKNGEVYGFGENSNYELGLGHNNPVAKAVKLSFKEKILKIAPVENIVFFIGETNNIYVTGKLTDYALKFVDSYCVDEDIVDGVGVARKMELSTVGNNKIVDITGRLNVGGYEPLGLVFLTDIGEIYRLGINIYSPPEQKPTFYKDLSAHTYYAKVADVDSCRLYDFILNFSNELYAAYYFEKPYGGESPKWVYPELLSENVKDFVAADNSDYVAWLTNEGEVYYSPKCVDEYDYIDEEYSVLPIKKIKVNLTNKASYLVPLQDRIGILCENGEFYTQELSDMDGTKGCEFVGKIDFPSKIKKVSLLNSYLTDGENELPKYVFAYKVTGKEWEICSFDETVGLKSAKISTIEEWVD